MNGILVGRSTVQLCNVLLRGLPQRSAEVHDLLEHRQTVAARLAQYGQLRLPRLLKCTDATGASKRSGNNCGDASRPHTSAQGMACKLKRVAASESLQMALPYDRLLPSESLP